MTGKQQILASVAAAGLVSCATTAATQLLTSAVVTTATKAVSGLTTTAATPATSAPAVYAAQVENILTGCLLFGGPSARLAGLTGDGRAIDLGAGDYGWLFATSQPGEFQSPLVRIPAQRFGQHCDIEWGGDATPTSSIENPDPLHFLYAPLDGVRVGDKTYLYFAKYERDLNQPLGMRGVGFGVASQNEAGVFVAPDHLLFGPEQPNFGTSVVPWGDTLYVFGCRSDAALLSGDCFLAEVPTESIEDETEYEFVTNDLRWSSNPSDAGSVFRASSTPSVTFDKYSGEFWMTYVPPLGSQLLFRRAEAIQGPWSDPISLGSCEVPVMDSMAFCTAAVQHPEGRNTAANTLALSYGIGTLSRDAMGLRASTPKSYWTRFVDVPVPAR